MVTLPHSNPFDIDADHSPVAEVLCSPSDIDHALGYHAAPDADEAPPRYTGAGFLADPPDEVDLVDLFLGLYVR